MLITSVLTLIDILTVVVAEIEAKIVQGSKTGIQYHPYSASISIVDKSNNAYMCGSSILNQKLILTAAHCFESLTPKSKVKANIGSTNRHNGYAVKITTVKVHPEYDEREINNDIALAGLEKPVQFSGIVNRVALARTRPQKGVAKLAGWGLVNEVPMTSTDVLHVTEQKIWTRKECIGFLRSIPEGTFCGGTVSQHDYPSIGDSGSALVMNGYLQIGLVSFKKVDISRSIIIYTDIAYFYNWISENAGNVYCG